MTKKSGLRKKYKWFYGMASYHDYSHDRTVSRKYREGMIAASRSYPCGTVIKVFNWNDKYKRKMKNPRYQILVIRDWGPARWTNRVLDLNDVAFKKISSLSSGVIRVSAVVIKRGKGNCVHAH